MSEAEFIAKQAEAAGKAISSVITELTHNLAHGVDPRGWTKEHPWMMVAGATVAGFVGAALTVPSKEEQALRKLARIEKALMPTPGPREPVAQPDGEDAGAKSYSKGHSSFMSGLGRQVLEAVKPAIMSALTAGITAKASQPPQPQPAEPPAGTGSGYAASQTGAETDPSGRI